MFTWSSTDLTKPADGVNPSNSRAKFSSSRSAPARHGGAPNQAPDPDLKTPATAGPLANPFAAGILVATGEDACGQSPELTADEARAAGIDVYVIGYDTWPENAEQLSEVAVSGGHPEEEL
ncbi:MAG: hypothetical protein ABGZ17_15375, partial [Planctomycetaceae bacterium]